MGVRCAARDVTHGARHPVQRARIYLDAKVDDTMTAACFPSRTPEKVATIFFAVLVTVATFNDV